MNSRRYPRTMSEAFGPYTDNRLLPMRETTTERAAGVWLAVTIGVVLAAALVSWWSS